SALARFPAEATLPQQQLSGRRPSRRPARTPLAQSCADPHSISEQPHHAWRPPSPTLSTPDSLPSHSLAGPRHSSVLVLPPPAAQPALPLDAAFAIQPPRRRERSRRRQTAEQEQMP